MKVLGVILTALIAGFINALLSAWVLMWCLSVMHNDYHNIPAAGFWFCFVFCMAVNAVVPYRSSSKD